MREQVLIPVVLSVGFLALVMSCYCANEAAMNWMSAMPASAAGIIALISITAIVKKTTLWLYGSAVASAVTLAYWLSVH